MKKRRGRKLKGKQICDARCGKKEEKGQNKGDGKLQNKGNICVRHLRDEVKARQI